MAMSARVVSVSTGVAGRSSLPVSMASAMGGARVGPPLSMVRRRRSEAMEGSSGGRAMSARRSSSSCGLSHLDGPALPLLADAGVRCPLPRAGRCCRSWKRGGAGPSMPSARQARDS